MCGVDPWRPIDDVLAKRKAHEVRGSEYNLFIAHEEVLKLTGSQRLTHEEKIVRLHV